MKILGFLVGAAALAAGAARADGPVIVHEWGTFTCLQDEHGNAIGGINVDDEPVPGFVWGSDTLRDRQKGSFGLPPYQDWSKGWRPADQDVTMRLETPVIYFYSPEGAAASSVPPLDVHVDFRHGVLSQFYPYAEASGWSRNSPLDARRLFDTTSSLDWKDVRLGSTGMPVQTDDKVWTAPRETGATLIETRSPIVDGGTLVEKPLTEHFLFYRGVGHLDSPLRHRWDFAGLVGTRTHFVFSKSNPHDAYPASWLVEIKADGRCAYSQAEASGDSLTASSFYEREFSADNLAKLKASMHAALVDAGLFDDEATAMLNTWELSYFKSPGLRFFYIVPRTWVDDVLPLKITGAPARVTRVMIGRIELISPEQRAALARLAAGPCPDLATLKQAAQQALNRQALTDADRQAFLSGARPLGDLGVEVPPRVRDYLSLGRFRDALIIHEQAYHPSPALAQFIRDNQL